MALAEERFAGQYVAAEKLSDNVVTALPMVTREFHRKQALLFISPYSS